MCVVQDLNLPHYVFLHFFFFSGPAPTQIYTLSLHDALPIFLRQIMLTPHNPLPTALTIGDAQRSEEHTSELQSPMYLVCRLLLEKKNGLPSRRPRRSRLQAPCQT